MNERQVLINLAAGAYLADHMGDIQEDIRWALKQIGLEVPEDCYDLRDIGKWLAYNHNATTVWGSSLKDEEQ